MIPVDDRIAISEDEIHMDFVRSAGPGGQNVNKVATAVQLRFDAAGSPSLPEDVRMRLIRLAGKKISREGILIIEARRHRTQEQNRKDALERLVLLIQKAAQEPKIRRNTRPTAASKRRRIQSKVQRGKIKEWRKSPGSSED